MHKGLIGKSEGGASVKQDITLGDYIQRKLRNDAFNSVNQERNAVKQEQTFDQWFTEYNRAYGLPPGYEVAKAAWYAAKGK